MRNTKPSLAEIEFNIFVYGKDKILSHFGTLEITREEIVDYLTKRRASWGTETFIIPYNIDNTSWVVRQMRKLGVFTIHWETHENNIIITAENPADLAYMRLIYNMG